MAEQKVSPIDPSTLSWRDKLRNLATTRYGYTGKQLAEAILGESEEEKYMNYLEKIEAGLLPPPKNFTSNRPVSDMFGGEGISDIGILDATLAGISGMAIPKLSTAAALTESGVLGADAVGEYRKGNTVGAAIMGTLAGVPPLLRYANPVKNISSKEVAEDVTEGLRQIQFPSGLYKDQRMSNNYINPETREVFKKDPKSGELIRLRPDQYPNYVYDEVVKDRPDLQRRKVVQGLGIGALAAPFMGDPLVMATRSMTKAPVLPGLAKLTPPIKEMLDYSNYIFYNNKLVDNLVEKFGKPAKLDYDQYTDSMPRWRIAEVLENLASKDISNLSLKEIRQLAKKTESYGVESDSGLVDFSDDFLKQAINTVENLKDAVRNDPNTKEIFDTITKFDEDELIARYDTGAIITDPYELPEELSIAIEKYLD